MAALDAEQRGNQLLFPGVMGISALHLETGVAVDIRGNEHFPVASTYKVPLAVTLLQQVDEGEKRLSASRSP